MRYGPRGNRLWMGPVCEWAVNVPVKGAYFEAARTKQPINCQRFPLAPHTRLSCPWLPGELKKWGIPPSRCLALMFPKASCYDLHTHGPGRCMCHPHCNTGLFGPLTETVLVRKNRVALR